MIPIDENRVSDIEGLPTFITKQGKLICAACGLSVEDIRDEPEMKKTHLEFHKGLK